MTSLIAYQMRRRDYHQRKAKGNKNGRHWCVYRQLRNRVNRDIKKPKSEYYINLTQEEQGNAKESWKALKKTSPSSEIFSSISSVCIDGVVVTSANSVATTLNSFFASIGRKLVENFPDSPLFPQYETNPSLSEPGFSF